MKISIISINYKKKEMTVEFIATLYHFYKDEFEKNEMEVVLVDNASDDGSKAYITKEIVAKKYMNIRIIDNKTNEGFAKGCNTGVNHARGEFVLFLNNDIQIGSRGFLEMMVCMQKNITIAIIGGKMKNTNGSPQLSAWKFYTFTNTILMLLGFERFGMLNESPKSFDSVDWVTGGCMMVNKKIFTKLGGFDTNFFMYMEDMELCFRAKNDGYAVYYYPDITLFHAGQGSSNRTFAIVNIYKGILYFYQKHMPTWQYVIIKVCLMVKAKSLIMYGKLSRKNYFIQTYEQALTVI